MGTEVEIKDEKAARQALFELIDAIESTGGLEENEDGFLAPKADPDWIDVAYAYTMACFATGRKPAINTTIRRASEG